jgi:hypothetical protein
MPTLTLLFHGEPLAFTLEKIDRDKLYGYVETETVAADSQLCERATLAGDGHTLAGKGDTAITYLSPDGHWRERSALRPVDATDGALIVPAKPTFAFPVNLDGKQTTLDDYLSHNIRLVYQLVPAGDASCAALLAELEEGTIYRFPFSYRGGDLADAGFLLAADGHLFLCVGTALALAYATLDTPAALTDDEDDVADDDEELDFGAL